MFQSNLPKGAFRAGQVTARDQGLLQDGLHQVAGGLAAFRAAVAQAQGDEHVGQPHDAQADGAPVVDAAAVLVQGLHVVPVIQDFVQAADGRIDGLVQFGVVDGRVGREFVFDHVVQVDGTQIAAVIGIAVEFGAGVGHVDDVFRIPAQQVVAADAVDEDGSRIAVVPLGLAEFTVEFASVDGLADPFVAFGHVEMQLERLVFLDGVHELARQEHGNVHGFQLVVRLFDFQEFLDVRVFTR